jgi:hypothetical protein
LFQLCSTLKIIHISLKFQKFLHSIPSGEIIILPLNAKLSLITAVVEEFRTDCSLKLTCGLSLEQIEYILKNLKR